MDLHTEFRNRSDTHKERQPMERLSGHDSLLPGDIRFRRGYHAFQRLSSAPLNRMPRERHGLAAASDESPSSLTALDEAFFPRPTSGMTAQVPMVDCVGKEKILENFFS